MSNQATGAAEDRRNKPHRPIPTGLVTTEGRPRVILAAAFIALPVLAQVFLVHQELRIRTSALVWDVVFALTNWHLAVRILLRRTPSADHATYQRYCWLWCWLLTAPLLVHGR